ncbi:MAG TPA: prolipoprotein diacylglyceryl transferase [Candidatus Limnocylindria bacterium]|nr:prolipoprotein diacylglyceryl transferase [Candidatus Limnocylindria bacterium]
MIVARWTGSTWPTSIPSPDQGVWHLGPFPLRAYALCIILGIFVAVWVTDRRWQARGGSAGTVGDLAIWAVPFGIIGGRVYHVITSPQAYFGDGGNPVDALRIWNGGLGIWGAVAFGALGAWIACRRRGIPLPPFGDAVAPGLALAQAIGRWGNWFNQELYGRPTDLPWGLEIDPAFRPEGYADATTFHPTFLYESLWLVAVAGIVVWADRRFTMGHGRVFALYVLLYTAGRGVIETVRIDEANTILGLRVNLWVSGLVFVAAAIYLVVSARLRPGRESEIEPGPAGLTSAEETPSDDTVEERSP